MEKVCNVAAGVSRKPTLKRGTEELTYICIECECEEPFSEAYRMDFTCECGGNLLLKKKDHYKKHYDECRSCEYYNTCMCLTCTRDKR